MNLIKTPCENKIALEFFKGFTHGTTVTKKLYPSSTTKVIGIVANKYSIWNNAGYIEEKQIIINKKHLKGKNKGKSYSQIGPGYRLNLEFLFDYLKEEKKIRLTKRDKKILRNFLDKKEIREFLYYWIKDIENGNLLAENIISFIRAIFSNSSDVMLMHGFNKNIAIKYFEIKDIMWNFEFPKNNKKRNIVKNLYEKIDEKYDYVPLLLKKNPNFEEDTTDAKEKKIWESIWGSKKNN